MCTAAASVANAAVPVVQPDRHFDFGRRYSDIGWGEKAAFGTDQSWSLPGCAEAVGLFEARSIIKNAKWLGTVVGIQNTSDQLNAAVKLRGLIGGVVRGWEAIRQIQLPATHVSTQLWALGTHG